MMRFAVKPDQEKAGNLVLVAEEGAKEWRLVESNYKMIMDWLCSNLGFKERAVEDVKAKMDVVAIYNARLKYYQALVEEARISASSKTEYYFNILDPDLTKYEMK